MRYPSAIAILLASFSLQAEEEIVAPAPEPPVSPSAVESGENLEPEITIIRRDDKIVHEYRANGQIYMVKIIPETGPAYYLVDKDGDGNMETRHSDLDKDLNIPQWLLHSW